MGIGGSHSTSPRHTDAVASSLGSLVGPGGMRLHLEAGFAQALLEPWGRLGKPVGEAAAGNERERNQSTAGHFSDRRRLAESHSSGSGVTPVGSR